MKIGAIENIGPNTLVSFLRNTGVGCARIDIAVAFISAAGLDSVLYLLKRSASRGRVRVLTGLYQGFTDPKALRTLLREQEQTGGRLAVRLSRDGHFHWKAYLLATKGTAKVIIGSSNLTDYGLQQSGELNLVLSLPTASKEFCDLQGIFDRHWAGQGEPLTAELTSKYERWRKEADPVPPYRSVPVRKILGGTPKKKKPVVQEVRYWRTCITGYFDKETEQVLQTTTNWDQRRLLYFSTWSPTFRIGDRVILFDLSDGFLAVIEIKDTTQTPDRTPDGHHFAAYRRLRRFARRRLVKNRWKAIEAAGLLNRKDDAYQTRKLSKKRFGMFLDQLKKS